MPDVGQTEEERGESREWALMYKFLAELYPMASILIQINVFFLLKSIFSPAFWITKINKFISETFFLLHFSYQLGNSALL